MSKGSFICLKLPPHDQFADKTVFHLKPLNLKLAKHIFTTINVANSKTNLNTYTIDNANFPFKVKRNHAFRIFPT